jgi:hypothetical protein
MLEACLLPSIIFINMLLLEEILKIKKLMNLNESKMNKDNLFYEFDYSSFKDVPPPSDDSEKTKEELKYLKSINLDKLFVQEKDDMLGTFMEFLDDNKIDYNKKFLKKVYDNMYYVVLDLKSFYKRPRPFRLDPTLTDSMLDSMEGFAYPSGHSTTSNLLCMILTYLYPKYKKDFNKLCNDITYSRQMAKAHYPSDIYFGKKLATSMFEYLKDNDLIP